MASIKLLRTKPTEKNSNGRTPFPEATRRILTTLATKERSFTISGLESETGINRKTIEKAVKLMIEAQELLKGRYLVLEKVNKMKLIRLREVGLSSLPEDTQLSILRTMHFPKPSEEDEILVHLLLKGATNEKTSIALKITTTLKKLKKQGQIIQSKRGNIFLSDEGCIVAKGALRLYPELKILSKT